MIFLTKFVSKRNYLSIGLLIFTFYFSSVIQAETIFQSESMNENEIGNSNIQRNVEIILLNSEVIKGELKKTDNEKVYLESKKKLFIIHLDQIELIKINDSEISFINLKKLKNSKLNYNKYAEIIEIKEINSVNPDKQIIQYSISGGIVSSINIGVGKLNVGNPYTKEKLIIAHIGTYPLKSDEDFFLFGLYYQTNYFKNPEREGWFLNTNFGLDFISMPSLPFDPGGSSGGKDSMKIVFPIISGGGGYSIAFKNSSNLKFSLDLGLKAVIGSLNISYTY